MFLGRNVRVSGQENFRKSLRCNDLFSLTTNLINQVITNNWKRSFILEAGTLPVVVVFWKLR